jgi:hypothetical protein
MTNPSIRTWALACSLALVVGACTDDPTGYERSPDPTLTPLFGATEPFNGIGACMGNDAYNSTLTVGMNSPDALNCTANDIYLARALATHQCPEEDSPLGDCTVIPEGTDITCSFEETVYVRVVADIGQSANSTRHDIGAWINPLEQQAQVGNSCYHYNLVVGSDGTFDADSDDCADMAEGAQTSVDLGILPVLCQPGPDNKVLLGSCLSWTQPGGDRHCPVAGNADGANGFRWGTVPQNKSKCNCEPFELNIFVPGTVTIRKETQGGDGTFQYTSATLGNFPLTTVGGVAQNVITDVAHGSHSITETEPVLPWEFVELSCNASGDGTSITSIVGRTATFNVGPGGSVVCTYKNRKRASITIRKETVPPGGTGFTFSQNIDGSGNFSLDHNGSKQFPNVVANGSTSYLVTELAKSGYDLTDIDCTGLDEANWTANLGARNVSITPHPGEDIVCTFENSQLARLIVEKQIVGGGAQLFTFSRTGIANFVLGHGGQNDSGVTLQPGTYTVCELDLAVTWSATATVSGGAVALYNPDAPGDDLGNRCVDVELDYGDVKTVVFTNTPPPGGDARTIGYWRNWSSCSSGNQYEKATGPGGFGWDKTLDGALHPSIQIGSVVLSSGGINNVSPDCQKAVWLLSKRTINNGQNRANDAAYDLAAQLLAALLNKNAGAGSCQAADDAIQAALALMTAINFNGTGNFFGPRSGTIAGYTREDALALADTLDQYNNNLLCP